MLEKELFLGVCFTILAGIFIPKLFLDMHTVDLYLNFGPIGILSVLQRVDLILSLVFLCLFLNQANIKPKVTQNKVN